MIRVVLIEIGLLLLPFVGFAAYLVFSKKIEPGPDLVAALPVPKLVIAGLVLMIAGLLTLVNFSSSDPTGTYVPAQYKDGTIQPGRFEKD